MVLSKIAALLLGPGSGERQREAISASCIAAMSLPMGALLLFGVWLPGPLRQLMEQASSIIRGA